MATDIIVNPGDNIQNVINSSQCGDVIMFNAGSYGGTVHLQNKSCTELNPLIIKRGNGMPHITGTASYSSGTTFRITNSSYIALDGIKVSNSLYGIYVTLSDHIIIENCEVTNTGQEGIHALDDVDFLDIRDCHIHHTGRRQDHEGWGEGIYIGGSSSSPNCSQIFIEGNEIYECGFGEGINIKASDSEEVTIKNNHIHDIHPGKSTTPNSQWNGGAIGVSHHFVTTDRQIWIEDNLIENIYGGQTSNTGIMAQPSSVRVVRNTIRNCDDRGIWFNDFTSSLPCWNFGNTYSNNGTNVHISTNAQVFNTNPGLSPFSPQSWYGEDSEPPIQNADNIALNKPVVSTAEQIGSEGSKAVDGSRDDLDRWSAEFFPQSIEINLLGSYALDRIDMFTLNGRAYQYIVEVKVAEGNYTQIVNRSTNTSGGVVITDVLNGVPADFVKFTFTGAAVYDGDWISIREIEIFGSPISQTDSIIVESEGTIYISNPESSIILTAPNGNCYQLTVNNNGEFISTAIDCP